MFIRTIASIGVALCCGTAVAQVTLYEHEGFHGSTFEASRPINNLQKFGFNDRASSLIVEGANWLVCTDADFRGACRVLRPGSYESLSGMGLANRISSLRPAPAAGQYQSGPAPLPAPTYDYRRRPNEELTRARVISARAVYARDEKRCWVERERVDAPRSGSNVAGAIIGGIVGGVLGHQVGGGRGQAIATGVGAVGGAAVGANFGRERDNARYGQDVEHCSAERASGTPEYWDVTYEFNGETHRTQLTSAPGETIAVSNRGEPRDQG